MDLPFDAPAWLWFLPPAAAAALAAGGGKARAAARSAAAALLVLGMAAPRGPQAMTTGARVYLVDASASFRHRLQEALDLARRDLEALPPDAPAGVIAFGARPEVELGMAPARAQTLGTRLSSEVDASSTDVAAAVAAAGALLGRERGAAIVLLSDGRDATAGAWPFQVPAEVPVSPVLLPPTPARGLRLLGVSAPLSTAWGEDLTLAATVALGPGNPRGVVVRVEGPDGGQARRVEVPGAGLRDVEFSVRPPAAGLAVWRVRAEEEGDAEGAVRGGESRAVAVLVTGPARALIVGSGAAAAALQAAGLQVEVVAATDLPREADPLAPYGLVVLSDVSYGELGAARSEALRRHVELGGAGLVLAGGRRAYSLGGWGGTALEALSPLVPESGGPAPGPLTLLLALDGSGSMAEAAPGGPTRYERAVRAILPPRGLGSEDRVGAVVFDAGVKLVVPPQSALDGSLRERLLAASPGGGTDLAAGVAAALDLAAPAGRVHLVALSDGVSDSPPEVARRLEERLAAAADEGRVTLSVVAVGERPDRDVLLGLARAGRGRLVEVGEVDERLGEVLVREARLALGEGVVPGPVEPRVAPGAEVWPAGRRPPPLGGLARTALAERAEAELVLEDGRPVAARARSGLGRVVALATEPDGAWGEAWRADGALAVFLARAARWCLPETVPAGYRVEARRRAGRLQVEVDAEGREGLDLRARVVLADDRARGQDLALEPEGPGVYRASCPLDAPTEAVGVLVEEGLGAGATVRRGLARLEPRDEERDLGLDVEALEVLARWTEGRVLTAGPPWPAPERAGEAAVALGPWCYLAAVAFYLVELALALAGRSAGHRGPA